jgi:hypothetical protein
MFLGTQGVHIAGSSLSVAGRDIVNNLNSIHCHYDAPRDIWAILRSIPNFRKIYQDMLSLVTPDTGLWLVDGSKFRIWLEPNGDIKIFWGSGIRKYSSYALVSSLMSQYSRCWKDPTGVSSLA